MAIYDFYCKKCDKYSERILKYSELNNLRCVECGEELERSFPRKMNFKLIYNPAVHKSSWASEGYANTQRNRAKDE